MIDKIVADIKQTDQKAMQEAKKRWDSLIKPVGSLGILEELVTRYIGITGNVTPPLPRKAVVLMAGDHGVAEHGVSAYPQEVTVQMVNSYLVGKAGANVMARHAGADLLVIDVGVKGELGSHPLLYNRKISAGTNNFTKGPAMSREETLKAIETGIEVALKLGDKGYDVFALAEMGIGNTTSSAAIIAAFAELLPEQVVGRGSGINDERLKIKIASIRLGLEVNKPNITDPLDVLTKLGGYDIAGLVGVILAAASKRKAVILDGLITSAAGLIAVKLVPSVKPFLFASHLSVEQGHKTMLEIMGQEPMLNLGMRLGEGTGACLAMTLLDAGIKCYNEMATFAEAGVAVKEV